MSNIFNLTIEEVDVQKRRLFPQTVIKANTFIELLEQTDKFIEKHDYDFLDSCVVVVVEPQIHGKTFIPFADLTIKMTQHIFRCIGRNAEINDFKF